MSQREFWADHPDEYIPPPGRDAAPDISEPFRHPAEWVDAINPDRAAPGRNNNCGECARATELAWRGVPAQAAAYADASAPGERDARMAQWSGHELAAADFDTIQQKVLDGGHGTSALVAVSWEEGGGHWFNAVNHEGVVLAVDGQRGSVEQWPPSRQVSHFDASFVSESLAVVLDSDGRRL
jgi:hypothetical protein